MKHSAQLAWWSALVASTLAVAGCFGAPEECRGCIAALLDAGPLDVPSTDLPMGTGGDGSGGMVVGTGGMGTGGMASGGMGTGGRGTGGMGGMATGGMASGGMASGGMASGGMGTGGRGTGGMATGGAAGMGTGGRGTGGMGGMATGGAGGMGMGGASIDADMLVWYKFDSNANDSAMYGGTARNATTTNAGSGAAAYSTNTRKVGTASLNLNGSSSANGGYATVPNLTSQLSGAVTIAFWVNVRGNQNWQRVFDFGTMAGTPMIYMFLTTNQAATTPNSVRFSISTTGNGANEQSINQTTPAVLSTGAWHHIAIVLPAGATYTGTMYIDGAVAGTNNAMTLHPSDIAMPNAFIGRSQWANDPLFNGYIDDFRIYRKALTAAEVTALVAVQ